MKSWWAVLLGLVLRLAWCKFAPCPWKTGTEDRKLVVATCDTRTGWREFHAMKLWNVTGEYLRVVDGISMTNVCKGENWGKLGFLTKPLLYLNFIKRFMSQPGADKTHVILMDSDTFWAASNLSHIWHNYDCARGSKHAVVSTEMSCWVGRYCNQTDIDKWYSNAHLAPSYSPFVNSGVVMGQIHHVARMLDHVITHNKSYYTTYGRKYKFDDQLAIGDYALLVAPQEVAVDYHQQLSASCSVHAPGDPPDEGWPFLCKNRNGSLSFSCHIFNNIARRQGHFHIDKSSCLVQRVVTSGMVLREELSSLAPLPIIWHGNGTSSFSPVLPAELDGDYEWTYPLLAPFVSMGIRSWEEGMHRFWLQLVQVHGGQERTDGQRVRHSLRIQLKSELQRERHRLLRMHDDPALSALA